MKFKKFRKFFFFFSVSLLSFILYVSDVSESSALDIKQSLTCLDSRWYIYSSELHKFIPFVSSNKINEKFIVLPIGRYEFPQSKLSLDFPRDSYLFINGKYVSGTEFGEIRYFNLDSLFDIYSTDSLILGFYYPGRNPMLPNACLIPLTVGKVKLNMSYPEINSRKHSTDLKEFVIIGLLISIAYLGFLYNYDPKLFRQYFSILKIFSRPETDVFLSRSRLLAGSDQLFVILESILLGFFCHLIMYRYQSDMELIKFNFFNGTFYWFILSLILILWNFIKYNLARGLTRLFQIKEVIRIQFFESKRITILLLLIYTILTIILLYGFKIQFNSFLDFLIKSLIIMAILRFLLISIKILNYTPYKKMYIISYLCTSELIPVIIGLKLILDTSLEKLI